MTFVLTMHRVILGAVIAVVAIAIYIHWSPKYVLPESVHEGDVIKCSATGKVFRISGGKKRYYSWVAYVHDGKPAYTVMPCSTVSAIPDGADMPE